MYPRCSGGTFALVAEKPLNREIPPLHYICLHCIFDKSHSLVKYPRCIHLLSIGFFVKSHSRNTPAALHLLTLAFFVKSHSLEKYPRCITFAFTCILCQKPLTREIPPLHYICLHLDSLSKATHWRNTPAALHLLSLGFFVKSHSLEKYPRCITFAYTCILCQKPLTGEIPPLHYICLHLHSLSKATHWRNTPAAFHLLTLGFFVKSHSLEKYPRCITFAYTWILCQKPLTREIPALHYICFTCILCQKPLTREMYPRCITFAYTCILCQKPLTREIPPLHYICFHLDSLSKATH